MISDALLAGVEALKGAGSDATIDPRNANPPSAGVVARTDEAETRCGTRAIDAEVYLIVPNNGTPQALDTLTALLATALTVIDPDGRIELSEAVTLPGGSDPMPAFKIPLELATE